MLFNSSFAFISYQNEVEFKQRWTHFKRKLYFLKLMVPSPLRFTLGWFGLLLVSIFVNIYYPYSVYLDCKLGKLRTNFLSECLVILNYFIITSTLLSLGKNPYVEPCKTFCSLTYVTLNQWNYFIHARNRTMGLQSTAVTVLDDWWSRVHSTIYTWTQKHSISFPGAVNWEVVVILSPLNTGGTSL